MKYLDRLIFLVIIFSILGFSYMTNESENYKETKTSLVNTENTNEVIVKSIPIYSYKPLPDMVASWYGHEFHGRKTANGEVFDKEELTAAHKTLPFGTILKITNKTNDKSVLVKINDRGPFVRNRDIDLSHQAASLLGLTHRGVSRVRVELVTVSDSILIYQ